MIFTDKLRHLELPLDLLGCARDFFALRPYAEPNTDVFEKVRVDVRGRSVHSWLSMTVLGAYTANY